MPQYNEGPNSRDDNTSALSQRRINSLRKLTENRPTQNQYNINQNFMLNINNILDRYFCNLHHIQHFSYDVTRHNSVIIRVRLFNGYILIKEFTTSGLILNNGIEINNFNPLDEVQVYNVVMDLRKRKYSQEFIAFVIGLSQSSISRIIRNPPTNYTPYRNNTGNPFFDNREQRENDDSIFDEF